MSRKSRAIGYGSAVLLVLVGTVVGIAVGGAFGGVLAIGLIGLGLVQAVALVFYEVGLSEDRERAREEERRRARDAERQRPAVKPKRGRVSKRLERRRGQRRRLD